MGTFRRYWPLICSLAILAGGGFLWYKALAIPMHDQASGPVCLCPKDDGKPPSKEVPQERYY